MVYHSPVYSYCQVFSNHHEVWMQLVTGKCTKVVKTAERVSPINTMTVIDSNKGSEGGRGGGGREKESWRASG